MQCTPAEIEAKKRQAQERLANKYKRLLTVNGTENTNSFVKNQQSFGNVSNQIKFNGNGNDIKVLYKSPNAKIGSPSSSKTFKPYDKPTIQFYGNNKVTTVKFSLISEERFIIELSTYSNEIIIILKTMPTKSYDPISKNWDFNMRDYDLLVQKLLLLRPNVIVEKLPNYAIKCCNMPKPDYSLIDLSKIDSELLNALMPFQIDGVCFGIDKEGRCLIADEMGLGKTFQALAIASYYRLDWPLLIVTTASMKQVWEETIHQYLPSVALNYTQYMVTAKDFIGDAKILIISSDLLQRCTNKLEEQNYGVIIIDESHTFKNFKAKCTTAATTLCKQAKRVILLSGTPALSRPSELYTQLTFLDEKFFGNFVNFSRRYCDGKKTQFGWNANGVSNLKELGIVLSKKFMIRRTKDDALKMLPNKVQEVVQLDVKLDSFSEEDKKKLNALAENYCGTKKAHDKQAALLTFFAESAKIKIPCICSYVLQTLDKGNKFIVFAHHQLMLNAIEKILVKSNRDYIRIDGNITCDKRKALVDKFQSDDRCECALLSITAANAGITLTAAKLVLFAELHWNPSILSQAESRAHRIGQENVVNVKYLLATGTADDYIWPMLEEKQKTLNNIGLSKDYYENVTITEHTNNKELTVNLNLTTSANTLDISSYFISPDKKSKTNREDCDMFDDDDDFDDLIANIDI